MSHVSSSREEQGVKLLFIHLPRSVSSPAGCCLKTMTAVCTASRSSGRLWTTSNTRPEKTSKHFEVTEKTIINKLGLLVALELKVLTLNAMYLLYQKLCTLNYIVSSESIHSYKSWSGFLFYIVPNFGNTPLRSAPQRTCSGLCWYILLSVY